MVRSLLHRLQQRLIMPYRSGLAVYGDKYSGGGSTQSLTIDEVTLKGTHAYIKFNVCDRALPTLPYPVQSGRTEVGFLEEQFELGYCELLT